VTRSVEKLMVGIAGLLRDFSSHGAETQNPKLGFLDVIAVSLSPL